MGRMIKRHDENVRLVVESDPRLFEAERTDGNRWNHVITTRFSEMLTPTHDALGDKHGLRRCEKSKLGVKSTPKPKVKPKAEKPKLTPAEIADLKLKTMMREAFRNQR